MAGKKETQTEREELVHDQTFVKGTGATSARHEEAKSSPSRETRRWAKGRMDPDSSARRKAGDAGGSAPSVLADVSNAQESSQQRVSQKGLTAMELAESLGQSLGPVEDVNWLAESWLDTEGGKADAHSQGLGLSKRHTASQVQLFPPSSCVAAPLRHHIFLS